MSDVPGAGDGRLDGDDLTWYDLFANGQRCPATDAYPTNEFQRMDISPRLPNFGNGFVDLDRSQLERYIAGLDPTTLAGGPAAPIIPFCVGNRQLGDEILSMPTETRTPQMLRIGSGTVDRHGVVEVPVEAVTSGGAITVQFTIHFDPGVLAISPVAGADANPDVIPGVGLPAGTRVIVNTSGRANGDLGVVVNFNGSASYPAVTSEAGRATLVVLRFRVVADARGGTRSIVTFGDNVFVTKMSGTLGQALPIDGGLVGGSFLLDQPKIKK